MEVIVLGSGTAVPVPDRFPAGYLVRTPGATILVDLGPGSLRRLAQAGVGLEDISLVLLTHYHTDHCADLAALLFGLRNPCYAGRSKLEIRGADGLHELLATLTLAWPWLTPKGYPLDVQEIEPGAFEHGDVKIQAVPIEHTDASLAYRITGPNGRSAAFSGDADVCPGLAEAARDTDLFICDAAFPGALRTPGHLTPELAGEAAQAAGARKLVLTHFYPECDGHDLIAEARAAFDGEIVMAEDLMRFDLS